MFATDIGRLTALAYFSLLTIGVIRSLAGVLANDIALAFAVDTYVVGYCFTLFAFGYSLALICNTFAIDKADIRKETAAAILLAFASVLAGAAALMVAVVILVLAAARIGSRRPVAPSSGA